MRRSHPLLASMALLTLVVSSQPSSFDLPAAAREHQLKWHTKTIPIALSTSLFSPAPALAPDSDVLGAVRRALSSWSRAAGVTFVELSSKAQSVSPTGGGDGINLITIAGTNENLALFADGNANARTRVFYDSETGDITEADIVLNPFLFSSEGTAVQFSTDGTPGTYDLESVLAHELGHLLGLSHSYVIGATMQASQALNGTYGLPAVTKRTLSETDEATVRSLYGPAEKVGAIEGRVLHNIDGNLLPASGANIWIEEIATGKVMGGTLTSASGRFSIAGIAPGDYRAMIEYLDGPASDADPITVASDRKPPRQRAFRSVEIASRVHVAADRATALNYALVPPQNSPPALNPRLLGINGELSTVPVLVAAGTKLTVYVGGEGVDQIPGSGLVISSPFLTVDPASLTLQQFPNAAVVISFEVSVAANAPPGDYTIRLQSNSGETAYLVGGLTIDPVK